jgi:hypothetical protein
MFDQPSTYVFGLLPLSHVIEMTLIDPTVITRRMPLVEANDVNTQVLADGLHDSVILFRCPRHASIDLCR